MTILLPSINILMKAAQQEIERRKRATKFGPVVFMLNIEESEEPPDLRPIDFSIGPGEPVGSQARTHI